MKFNDHSRLEGAHAFLSASKYHWVNYDDAKLIESYRTAQAAAIASTQWPPSTFVSVCACPATR